MTIARLEYYAEFGSVDSFKTACRHFIKQYAENSRVTDPMLRLADQLTPKIHLVTNVEYQTMRKGTKSYVLLPVRDNRAYGVCRLPEQLCLIREYNRKLNSEAMKRTLLNKAVVYGFYVKGLNEDSVMSDCMQALLRLNDNDIKAAMGYKQKKSRQFNPAELAGTIQESAACRFVLLDRETGEIYPDSGTDSFENP